MIRVAHDGPITTIKLDRADKRNALTPEMLAELKRAVEAIAVPAGAAGRSGAADGPGPTRAVVLTGDGPVFCAGFDLALCAASPDGSVMRELLTGLSRAIEALRACPCPVVIAAHGAAIAGGCALLGGADVVIADRGGKFGYPVLRIGVSPAVSGPFMAGRVGPGPTRARMLDTGLISGERAREIGLVHELVERAEDVVARAMAIAGELAAKPAGGMVATKRWLNEIEDGMREVDAEQGLAVSMGLTGTQEEREGIKRAMSKA